MDEADRKILENIERFGCSVMHIAAEDQLPPFAFSVGITKTAAAPEVVVIGLKRPIAHFAVNEYNRRVRSFVLARGMAASSRGLKLLPRRSTKRSLRSTSATTFGSTKARSSRLSSLSIRTPAVFGHGRLRLASGSGLGSPSSRYNQPAQSMGSNPTIERTPPACFACLRSPLMSNVMLQDHRQWGNHEVIHQVAGQRTP
jgi:Domain of unknown function (DUF4262)